MFTKRSVELEYIDKGPEFYTLEEYQDCLDKLGSIGRFLGGNSASVKAFDGLDFIPESILDVGCGGGAFTRLLAEKYPNTKVLGVDTSYDAINYAILNKNSLENLNFEYRENPKLTEAPKSFDVVTTTLVCHHMTDHQLIEFLQEASKVAKRAIIINDLHRHPMAYVFFAVTAPLFFRNRLILHDGLISIKRSFRRKDWIEYMYHAGLGSSQWQLTWNWAFRWVLTIKV